MGRYYREAFWSSVDEPKWFFHCRHHSAANLVDSTAPVSHSGVHRKCRGVAGLTSSKSGCLPPGFSQEALGKVGFLAHSGGWPNSVSCACRLRTTFPCWLLSGGCSQHLAATIFPGLWPLP